MPGVFSFRRKLLIRWLDARKETLFLVLFLLGALGLVYYLASRPPAGKLVIVEPDEAANYARELRVHVGGEVSRPGVYVLPLGARVSDAIDKAGGTTERGDVSRLELAHRVEDEESIIVPARRDREVQIAGQLNLNRASQAELENLPWIGPVTAKKILEYREKRGEFVNLKQLLDLKLINQRQLDEIRDLATVE